MLRDNLVGLIEPIRISAGSDPLALIIQKQASDDKSLCLENPRPERAESSLTENLTSPFQAEPAHNRYQVYSLEGSRRSYRIKNTVCLLCAKLLEMLSVYTEAKGLATPFRHKRLSEIGYGRFPMDSCRKTRSMTTVDSETPLRFP